MTTTKIKKIADDKMMKAQANGDAVKIKRGEHRQIDADGNNNNAR